MESGRDATKRQVVENANVLGMHGKVLWDRGGWKSGWPYESSSVTRLRQDTPLCALDRRSAIMCATSVRDGMAAVLSVVETLYRARFVQYKYHQAESALAEIWAMTPPLTGASRSDDCAMPFPFPTEHLRTSFFPPAAGRLREA